MFYEAAKSTTTTALRTAPRRSEYLSCFLLLALFRAPRKGGEAWSKLAWSFGAHILVCYCILNSKIAFKTLFYRADTDYWVCLSLKNTWLGQCPLGCHAVLGCSTTIQAGGLAVALCASGARLP